MGVTNERKLWLKEHTDKIKKGRNEKGLNGEGKWTARRRKKDHLKRNESRS